MSEWGELVAGIGFITDLGSDHVIRVNDAEQTLGRYAVWMPLPDQTKHQVVEVGTQVEDLMEKYSIPKECVYTLAEE